MPPFGPDPHAVHPNPAVPSLCYVKNRVTRPGIGVGADLGWIEALP